MGGGGGGGKQAHTQAFGKSGLAFKGGGGGGVDQLEPPQSQVSVAKPGLGCGVWGFSCTNAEALQSLKALQPWNLQILQTPYKAYKPDPKT